MNAIELNGLTKTYKTFQLGPIDLKLPMGTIMGLVGENGAGKSTTLKAILDLIKPTAGEITVLGQPVPDAYPALKEEIGVVLDALPFPGFLNAAELGHFMASAFRSWDSEVYASYLKKLHLPEKQKIKEYSRGMNMKLALATALSHHAKLLILDEATSGLDPMVRQEILDILYDFCDEEHAILISSHIVSDLEKICDYIAFLHEGKLLLVDEKDRLLEQYGLLKCSKEQLSELAEGTVLSSRIYNYGAEALVRRDLVPAGLPVDRITLEELIVALARRD
ncbi:MAG: ABC transporter ATP-binding protein [Oscillospiraceae bacterium]|nr:ABC transporter ATP-binding protein [Oscillospiraceae bacterium]